MRILIADDDSVSRRLTESFIRKWGYEVVLACDGKQAWEILQSNDPPRLALLDWMMPGMSGPEICIEVRKRSGYKYTYLVLITSREAKQDLIAGLEAGADDYLTKPIYPEELRARVRVGLRILDLEDQLLAARDAQQFKARHDGLTGLLNRAAISELLGREVARSDREGGSCGVLLADLDHFKSVNDSLGHAAGDDVLKETARRLKEGVRAYDVVGRYGGEEFLVVLPGCNSAGVRNCAEQILRTFRERPFQAGEETIPVTLSIGATTTRDVEGPTPESLVRAADDALYRAKRGGRDRVEVTTVRQPEISTPVSATTVIA